MRYPPIRFMQAATLLFLVASLAGSTQAGEPPEKTVRLLVSCSEGTRAKVLAALASLDVEVYDLATMARLEPEPAGSTSGSQTPSAGRIWDAIRGSLGEIQGQQGEGLEVRKLDIGRGRATVRITGTLNALAAAQSALARNPQFAEQGLRSGQAVETPDGRFESEISLRLAPAKAADALPAGVGRTLPVEPIERACDEVGARLRAMSAELVDRDAQGELVRRSLDLTVSSIDLVVKLVGKLDEIEGVRVTGLQWTASPKEEAQAVRIQVAMRRAE